MEPEAPGMSETLLLRSPPPERSDDAPKAAATKGPGKQALIGYTLFLLFAAVGNSFFFKQQVDAFVNYAYFLNQVTTVVYVPVFFGFVAYQKRFTNTITAEMRSFPKQKFFIMGALDALSGIFMTFGGAHTSGSLQALLLQCLIPVTMVLAYIFLRERYSRYQYSGSFLILLGVILSLLPSATASGPVSNNVFGWNIVFLCCVVPQAASTVFKEVAFQEDLDVNYLQFWVAFYQFIFGILLAPINTLKVLGPAAVPLSGIPSTLGNGFLCMLGYNSLPGDNCVGSWIPLMFYLIFNLLYNVSIVLVIKHLSANILNFAMTLRLPILQIVFALPFLAKPEKFHILSLIGLVIILAGLSLYRYAVPPPASGEEETVNIYPGALDVTAFTLRRKVPVLHRGPQTIRSGFYGRLGIGGSYSPRTQQFRRSFQNPHTNAAGTR